MRVSRLTSILLAFVLSFAGVRGEEPAAIRVATFSCDLTPPLGAQIGRVETTLLAKGIILDDGRTRCVLCAIDWLGLCNSSHRLFCGKVAEVVGTEIARVSIHTVHQHTAPYDNGDARKLLPRPEKFPNTVSLKFLELAGDRLAHAAKQSMDHFQVVDSIGTGAAAVERVASSRRILQPSGKVRQRMSATKDPDLHAMPEGDIDPLMRTITLAHGDKPLVRLHYYATHPQTFYGDPRASADMPGFAREKLQQKEGVFQIYFTGCAGDVALGKYNNGSRAARDEVTARLLAGMEASIAATRYAPLRRLAWRHRSVVLPPADAAPQKLAADLKRLADEHADTAARLAAASRLAFAQRVDEPIDLKLLALGPVRVLCLPGECMIEFQHFALGHSPAGLLAVAAYGDLGPGYICTEKAYSEGGYEPGASFVGPKAEGVLKTAIAELLCEQ